MEIFGTGEYGYVQYLNIGLIQQCTAMFCQTLQGKGTQHMVRRRNIIEHLKCMNPFSSSATTLPPNADFAAIHLSRPSGVHH